MASPAFNQPEWDQPAVAPDPAFVKLAEIGHKLLDDPAFTRQKKGFAISPAVARAGAKGFMIALGIEGAALLGLLGVWQIWRVFR